MRIEFAQKRGLCFNCLIPRHRAQDCRKRQRCEQCNKKHSSLLHKTYIANTARVVENAEHHKDIVVGAVMGGNESKQSGKISLPIVAVRVQTENTDEDTEVYAFIDPGSTTTFSSDDLPDKLNTDGEKMRFSLTTLLEENSMVEGRVLKGLRVSDFEGNNFVELPMVIARGKLPVTKADIPNQADIDRWPHLHGIKIPMIDAQ